jgi:hypothetical protein
MDKTIFQANDVQVSKTLVRIGATSYPVNSIGSVLVVEPNRLPLYILPGICATIGVVALPGRGDAPIGGVFFIIIAALVAWRGYARKSKLIFRTANGDQSALEDRDPKKLQEVKTAIERAVAMRG